MSFVLIESSEREPKRGSRCLLMMPRKRLWWVAECCISDQGINASSVNVLNVRMSADSEVDTRRLGATESPEAIFVTSARASSAFRLAPIFWR